VTQALAAILNLRDLGGTAVSGNQRIRSGLLFRSAMLGRCDPSAVAALHSLGIRSVIDLRGADERVHFPSPWEEIGATRYEVHHVGSGEGNLARLLEKPSLLTPSAIRAALEDMYRTIPFELAPIYRELFRALAANRTPLLFHCAGGKDRTGIAAALALTLLGVSRDDIAADYAKTNAFDIKKAVWDPTCEAYPQFANVGDDVVRTMLEADPAYIDAMFDAILSRCGSLDAYFNDLLDVGSSEADFIRHNLLEAA